MFACLFFGDSLAHGTAVAVNARYAQHCDVHAVRGAASTAMLRWTPPARIYDTAILSIGSNDDIGSPAPPSAGVRARAAAVRQPSRVFYRIARLRQNLPSRRVIWLLPYDRARAAIVESISVRFGDEVLDIAEFPSRDGLHPSSYDAVAKRLLR